MLPPFLPHLACVLAACVSLAAAADEAAPVELKRGLLEGTIPIVTKDLASFMEFGIRVHGAKNGTEVMNLWRHYDVSDKLRKSARDHAMHGWVGVNAPLDAEAAEKGIPRFVGATAEWIPKDPKDPRSLARIIAHLQSDERALVAAVVNHARIESGFTQVTRIELTIGSYLGSMTDPRGNVDTYMWTVELADGDATGNWSVHCVPSYVFGDRGLRLGKSQVYISGEGGGIWKNGKPVKAFNRWSKTLSGAGGSGKPVKIE